jgi:hypothetical protein
MATITFTTEQFNQLIESIGEFEGKWKLTNQLEKVQRLMETSDTVSSDDIMNLFKVNKSKGEKISKFLAALCCRKAFYI